MFWGCIVLLFGERGVFDECLLMSRGEKRKSVSLGYFSFAMMISLRDEES